nr:TetR/AcrR family transcriptional regulator [uncultured Noviherbaspirillum sp.]
MNTAAKPARKRAVLGERSERRVREILGVARQVFSDNGYESATTLDIARRAGISEATVFSYFASKRDLCMQVIKGWYDEISQVLEQEVPQVAGTRAQLHYVVHKHLVTLMQDGTGMCKLVLSEGRSADAEFAGMIAELKRRYTAPLMKVLAAAQRTGEIRQDMPLPLLRDMVYGSMEHVLWDYMVNRNKPDVETTARQLTEMLWTAFEPAERSLQKLAQFRQEVMEAVGRLEES